MSSGRAFTAESYRADKIAHCHEMIGIWRKCLKAIANSQSYQIGGKTLTRAHLGEVRRALREEEATLESLLGMGQRRIRRVVPIDD